MNFEVLLVSRKELLKWIAKVLRYHYNIAVSFSRSHARIEVRSREFKELQRLADVLTAEMLSPVRFLHAQFDGRPFPHWPKVMPRPADLLSEAALERARLFRQRNFEERVQQLKVFGSSQMIACFSSTVLDTEIQDNVDRLGVSLRRYGGPTCSVFRYLLAEEINHTNSKYVVETQGALAIVLYMLEKPEYDAAWPIPQWFPKYAQDRFLEMLREPVRKTRSRRKKR